MLSLSEAYSNHQSSNNFNMSNFISSISKVLTNDIKLQTSSTPITNKEDEKNALKLAYSLFNTELASSTSLTRNKSGQRTKGLSAIK
jgi:hypothetical protein